MSVGVEPSMKAVETFEIIVGEVPLNPLADYTFSTLWGEDVGRTEALSC
jgi:hypothetical protein